MKTKSNKINLTRLIAAIVICQLAGAIGSAFTFPAISTWYATLQKPAFSPPNWLFGPVWILLYTLMGISAYLVWEKGINNKEVRHAVTAFGAQLALNTLWSILFFGLKSPLLGLICIIALWLAIVYTTIKFGGISKQAGWLLGPYIIWVTFAAILNFSIWQLNS
jgi:tryptophan-rich sensory protein